MSAAPPSSRGSWGSQFGFIMAAVGSAIGLGNMWRFPYQMAENGGAAFLILYLGMVLLVGLPILFAEFAIGRGSGKSPIDALIHFGGEKWKVLGMLFVVSGFLILAYYAVISGWLMTYTYIYLFEGSIGDPGGTFEAYSTGPIAIFTLLLFMVMTLGIVAGGVEKGIERTSVWLMPILFIVVAGMAIYAAFLSGSGPGYTYFLQPDFGDLLSLDVLASAAGQAFFSLSLGMGAMLTYASYLQRKENLPKTGLQVAGIDVGVSFVAGLMVFPLIFALGLQGQVGESTVGALFITLPQAFSEIGGFTGRFIGIVFFSALFVGALTSAISLLEVVVSTAVDTLKWTRKQASLVMGLAITAVGIPCAINLNVLTIYDTIAGEVFLIIGGLFIAIFVGWVMKDPVGELAKGMKSDRFSLQWIKVIRYVVPPLLIMALAVQVMKTIRVIAGIF